MNSDQIDKYNMVLKVDDFFDDHTADTAAHSQIAPKHAELKVVIAAIQVAGAEAGADNTGVAEDKKAERIELEQQAFMALTAVASFARDTNNRTLLRKVDFTLSDLQGMRDATLHFNATIIQNSATTHIAALAAYAYLPAQLTALGTAISDFVAISTEPKDAKEYKAVANEQVVLKLKEADVILEKLDGYMDTFRFSNVALYSEYGMARAIDNAGGGTGGGGEDGYSAAGTLAPMMVSTVLEFEYDPALNYTFTNLGTAPSMEATLLLDGAPVAAAPPIIVNLGTPAIGVLSSWGPVGNQISLRNTSPAMGLDYEVKLELP